MPKNGNGKKPEKPEDEEQEEKRTEENGDEDEKREVQKPASGGVVSEFTEGAKIKPDQPIELQRLHRAIENYVGDKAAKDAIWDYFVNAPPQELNPWSLFNACSAHRIKDTTIHWIVHYVFPDEASNPYGNPNQVQNPYPAPSRSGFSPQSSASAEEDAVQRYEREAREEDARTKAMLSRRERMAIIKGMEHENDGGGGGGVGPGEVIDIVKTVMEMKNQGSSPAEILDVALKLATVTAAKAPENGGTSVQLELARFQAEERQRSHEREIALLTSKGEAEKNAALAQANASNPASAIDATMGILGKFQSAGLASAPASPQAQKEMRELDLRYGLAQMKAAEEKERRQDEIAFRRQKELQDQATGDRLVQLANKAVETIAEPISRAVGESIKGGAARPQGMPQAPVPMAQPLTREQQIDQLKQLQQRARAAQEELERQGQGQPGP